MTKRYDERVDTFLIESSYFDYDVFYSGVILGSIYSTLDMAMLFDFLMKIRQDINKSKEIEYLLFLCIEETVVTQNILREKNIENIRKKNYKKVLELIENNTNRDRVFNVFRRAYMYKKLGKTLIFPKNIKMIISDVLEFRYVNDTLEFVNKFKELIEKYFHMELSTLQKENYNYNEKLEKQLKLDREKIMRFFNNYITSDYMPNETMIDKNFKSKDPIQVDEEDKREWVKFKKIENYYGKSEYSMEKLQNLEKKYSKGIHKSYHLFFTEGKLETIDDDYRRKTLKKELLRNKTEYLNNKNLYDKTKENLKRVIRQNISTDEFSIYKSYGGNIEARKTYRAKKINDNKIFKRKRYKNLKKFKIDIVLDSSASLLARQSFIAVQSYMIISALEELNIENSLKTYNNFMDYTVIKTLKKYEEKDTKRAFDYYSSGGNRDGLALKVIGNMEKMEIDDSHLIIVFTDAKPYDVQVVHKVGHKERRPYKDEEALRDTAKSVRELRRNDATVVCIYAGEESDMTDVHKIYGKDFIYVEDIKNFANKVGNVISNHIRKING